MLKTQRSEAKNEGKLTKRYATSMKWGENAKVPESLRDRLIAEGAVPIMGTDGTYTRSATELAAMVIDAALPTLRTKGLHST